MTRDAYICDAVRTPFGRYGGALASIRADDLGAIPIRALMARNPEVDWAAVDDVIYGCANQAGEDNRNVARMALLLAGLPVSVPGVTVNRLCGSGMQAIADGARDMLSTPPASIKATSPLLIARAAMPTASMLEPHRRLTVVPGTSSGNPASSAAIRPTLRLSSPAWFAQP